MHGWETHCLWYQTHPYACVCPLEKMASRKRIFCSAHWNFLVGLCSSFLRMSLTSKLLWLWSSFTAEHKPIDYNAVSQENLPFSLLLFDSWYGSQFLYLYWPIFISLIGGTKDHQPTHMENCDAVSSRGSLALTQQGSPALPVLFRSSNQIAFRCAVSVCQQHVSL